MRFLITLTVLAFSLSAAALTKPTDLVTKAETDAMGLQEALIELQQNIPTLTNPTVFREYFAILPKLKELSVKLNLEQIYPGGVEKLGESMVAYGSRWLNLATDDTTIVNQHFDWMTPQTALRYLHQVEDDIFTLQGTQFELFAKNLNLIINVAKKNYTKDPYIELGYRDLLSQLAYQKLKVTPLTQYQEHLNWMIHIKNQDTVSSYVSQLQENVLAFSVSQENEVPGLMTILVEFQKYIDQNTFPVADAVKASIGYVVVELLDKSMANAWILDTTKMLALVDTLSLAHLNSLADRMMSPLLVPSPAVYKQYLTLTQRIISRLQQANSPQKAMELSQKIYSKIAPVILLAEDREGTYQLQAANSKDKWRFTVFQSSEGRLIAGLGRESGVGMNLTFFNVEYDASQQKFVASQQVVVNAGENNYFIHFSFNEKGDVTVTSPLFAAYKGETLTGPRIETYENYAKLAKSDATYIEGYFEGFTVMNGKNVPVKLSLMRFNENTMGRLIIDEHVVIELQEGTSGGDGYIYLTSNEMKSGSAMHLRLLQNSEDGLDGFSVLTGSGIRLKFQLNFIKH